MGVYLNSRKPHIIYRNVAKSMYFVDKTSLIKELILLVESGDSDSGRSDADAEMGTKYICITRPRRFGKTVMASMIASYFGKGRDSRAVFCGLDIGRYPDFEKHLNRHNVIYIALNEIPDECRTYEQYISRIKQRILNDLKRDYPDADIDDPCAVWDALNNIFELEEEVRFIFVLDEWDFLFHQDFATTRDKKNFINFLSTLLKDQPYVEFVYMTGIFPIAKYSSGSELNMFYEYTMATREKYSEYFGFTDDEVDQLYKRYLKITQVPNISRKELARWYDGYETMSGKRLYNPRSVVGALSDNQLGSYWTSSGPYDEIFYYVEHDIDQVRDDLALMVSGTPVPARIQEYAAVSMNLVTRDEILSAMVVYGFLSYKNGCVSIPNKELMDKFADMVQKEASLGYVYRLAKESRRMLAATKAGDTKTMLEILEYAHNTENPLLYYNNEAELAAVVGLVYLEARDTYEIKREDKAGIGYVDFIFYPMKKDDDCIILELKVDHTAKEAIQQIKERRYALNFQGKLGEKPNYTGRILAVGIAYDREYKKHCCEIEILREKSS